MGESTRWSSGALNRGLDYVGEVVVEPVEPKVTQRGGDHDGSGCNTCNGSSGSSGWVYGSGDDGDDHKFVRWTSVFLTKWTWTIVT